MAIRLKKGLSPIIKQNGLGRRIWNDLVYNKYVYLMVLPVIAYYIIFEYMPMYGAMIAFKDFSPMKGVLESPWVGFKHFQDFFSSFYFWRVIKNTFLINFYELIFGFPAPIILALLMNEIRVKYFKSAVQTITYMPHLISLVVICGIIHDFTASSGVVNDIIAFFGGERSALLLKPEFFRTIFVSSGIWQHAGWGTIIYLAALTGIDPELYEAANIDGAGRWKKLWHITLPSLLPTIVILLILRMGSILSVGFEKIILLYNPTTYETADVISSLVYRRGLQNFNYSFSTAVGLFNSLVGFILVVTANRMSKKVNQSGLW